MNKPYFLYIIDSTGVCLFHYNFKEKFHIFQKDLFSGFITAITLFSDELNQQLGYTKTKGQLSSLPINETFEIMISYKKPLIGALIVEKRNIDEDMKIFLNDLLNDFLVRYKDVLANWYGDIVTFETFKDEIERIFRKMGIFSFQIPKLKKDYMDRINKIENSFDIIQLIDGQKDINEISQKMEKTVDEIKNMISILLWHEIITLSEKVYDNDIFEPKRELFHLIRTRSISPEREILKFSDKKFEEFKLLESIDGFKTVNDLSKENRNLTINDVKRIISFYLSQGLYLEKVELYPQIIKISDKIRENLATESLALSYSLENICDGELSLTEVSRKTDIPIKEIKKMLDFLGKHVTYKKKYKK